jgi:hypothetical protein
MTQGFFEGLMCFVPATNAGVFESRLVCGDREFIASAVHGVGKDLEFRFGEQVLLNAS